MIYFFRRIREQLLGQGKTGTYFKYAIGEILLVVIGILIALSINNWNESRKDKQLAKEYLKSLRSDLIQDTTLIKSRYTMVTDWLEDAKRFKQRISSPNLTIDSLIKLARYEFDPMRASKVPFQRNSMTALLSTGQIRLIPKELADYAISYYFYVDRTEQLIELDEAQYQLAISKYIEKYSFESRETMRGGPLIQELIWKDVDLRDLAPRLKGITNLRFRVLDNSKWQYDLLLDKATELIQKLEIYLDN